MSSPLTGADLMLWIPPENVHHVHLHVSEDPLSAGEPQRHHLIGATWNRRQQVIARWSDDVGGFDEVVVSARLSNGLAPFPSGGMGQEIKSSG